jgi:2-polyprenyl-3-methyl-5-hydroxy-6-metoxy-1,4-benzoquinol methylase
MPQNIHSLIKAYINKINRYIATLTKKYYVEDYVRVYSRKIVFNRHGKRVKASSDHIKNFCNHIKFYKFASQFAGSDVNALDAGCGAGYGSKILKDAGSKSVSSFDISKHAISYAKSNFLNVSDFRICSITKLKPYRSNKFHLVVCSEVLEHIKEYNKESLALKELKRVMAPNALLVLGTPNNEMLPDHGFSYYEIKNLFDSHFDKYWIIENALVPFKKNKRLWEDRLLSSSVGKIFNQDINLNETVLPRNCHVQLKKGIPSGKTQFYNKVVETSSLHNSHSWIILAMK